MTVITQKTYLSRLAGRTPRVENIVSFRLDRPPSYQYLPGQWFVITFPVPGGPHTHHFSHSNSPAEPDLEFTTRMRDSEFKNALAALPVGAQVELEGPYGTFTLPEEAERVAFFAGGIGITCVRSILRWLAHKEGGSAGAHRSIVLFFANRREDAIPFGSELEWLETRVPGLRVVHIISQPRGDRPGHRGHLDLEVLNRELSTPDRWIYFLSGPPSFGHSVREQLLVWGAAPGLIRAERFDGYE